MQLQLSTWQEVEAYLGRASGIIVPTGSIEQHGPTGLIGTDAICAETIAARAGEQSGALVGPTIAFGVAQFNLGFPGTVNVRATTLMALVTDYVRSLALHGFDRFYFLNGHGGNIAPLRAVFQDIYAEAPPGRPGNARRVRCRLRSWWELPKVDALRKQLYGGWEGMHATPSEVAITQHAHPGAIKTAALAAPVAVSPEFLREHGGDNHFDADHHRRRFPDGRIGSDPSLATPEQGRQLLESAAAELALG